MMREEQIGNAAPMPTLRDDFVRIVARAQEAKRQLALVTRDIDRLLHGAKPEAPQVDDSLKDIGPQSISDCLSAYVREIGDIDVLTDKLKAIRDDLAPASTSGHGASDPISPYTDRETPKRGGRYG